MIKEVELIFISYLSTQFPCKTSISLTNKKRQVQVPFILTIKIKYFNVMWFLQTFVFYYPPILCFPNVVNMSD